MLKSQGILIWSEDGNPAWIAGLTECFQNFKSLLTTIETCG
jgi:hypothetical protein